MRRILTGMALPVAALLSVSTWAQDSNYQYYEDDQLAGETDEFAESDMEATEESIDQDIDMQQAGEADMAATQGTTTQDLEQRSEGYLWDEKVGIRPQLGVLNFKDVATGDDEIRGAAGVTFDANLMSMIDDDLKQVYLGPSTGAIYSRVGSGGSNFFGNQPSGSTEDTAHFLMIPLNGKLGYNFTPNFRIAAHGGGNLLYRSRANVMNLGVDNSLTSDSDWSVFPNVGADLEFGFGKNIALTFRPDWTFTDGDDVRVGTLAIAIPIG